MTLLLLHIRRPKIRPRHVLIKGALDETLTRVKLRPGVAVRVARAWAGLQEDKAEALSRAIRRAGTRRHCLFCAKHRAIHPNIDPV